MKAIGHICLTDVLMLFRDNHIIAYALPAHTSGKTRPLDCVVFGTFKPQLIKRFNSVGLGADKPSDVFDICAS